MLHRLFKFLGERGLNPQYVPDYGYECNYQSIGLDQ